MQSNWWLVRLLHSKACERSLSGLMLFFAVLLSGEMFGSELLNAPERHSPSSGRQALVLIAITGWTLLACIIVLRKLTNVPDIVRPPGWRLAQLARMVFGNKMYTHVIETQL